MNEQAAQEDSAERRREGGHSKPKRGRVHRTRENNTTQKPMSKGVEAGRGRGTQKFPAPNKTD